MKFIVFTALLVGCVSKPIASDESFIEGCSASLIVMFSHQGHEPHYQNIRAYCADLYKATR